MACHHGRHVRRLRRCSLWLRHRHHQRHLDHALLGDRVRRSIPSTPLPHCLYSLCWYICRCSARWLRSRQSRSQMGHHHLGCYSFQPWCRAADGCYQPADVHCWKSIRWTGCWSCFCSRYDRSYLAVLLVTDTLKYLCIRQRRYQSGFVDSSLEVTNSALPSVFSLLRW